VYITLPHILDKWLYVDPKSYLQEFTQGTWGSAPTYSVIEEIGADHNKRYRVSVSFADILLGIWEGTSKKKAEQDAAENALSARHEWEEKIPLKKKSAE
jgi:dsRNA-specific ribonuclease